MSDLILKLTPGIFLPNEYICNEGEIGTEMYIIMHGEVEVTTAKNMVIATLGKGKVFGEIRFGVCLHNTGKYAISAPHIY